MPEKPQSTKPAVEWISSPSRPEAGLALQARDEVVGQRHALERLAEHELARVEDEGLAAVHLHQLGEVLHRLAHVDVGVAGVVEDAEAAVHAHVHAGGLNEALVERLDHDALGLDLGQDGAVAEYHGPPQSSGVCATTQSLL